MAKPATNSIRHDFSEAITISVGGAGEEKQNVYIHTSFAIQSSEFLRAALEVQGARDKPIPLEVGVAEFQTTQEHGGDLLRLYILGDYLDDAKFCNAVMDVLNGLKVHAASARAFVLSDFSDNDVNWALEKTVAGSPLRVYLLTRIGFDIVGHHDSDSITSLRDRFSSDVLLDLLMSLMSECDLKMAINGGFLERKDLFLDRCAFHKHEDGDARCPGSQ